MIFTKTISLNLKENEDCNTYCNSYAQQFKHMNPLKLSLTENKPLNKERLLTLLTKHRPVQHKNHTQPVKNVTSQPTIKQLKSYAKKGDPKAQFILGKMYDRGDIVHRDELKATKWYKQSANQGFQDAIIELTNLGTRYYDSKNYKMAIKYYQFGVDKGYANSQYYLGFIYHKGYNEVPPDLQKAKDYYEQAAKQDHIDAINALNDLGILYYNLKNHKMAIECYQFGFDKGISHSQHNLGLIYKDGYNEVPPDFQKALDLFKKAAQQGHINAQKWVTYFKPE